MVGSWQPAQWPPLSLHSPAVKLSSTPHIPPLDKQIVLCSRGVLSPEPHLLHICPPHTPDTLPSLSTSYQQARQKTEQTPPFFFQVPLMHTFWDRENIPANIPQTTGPFNQQLKLTLNKLCPIKGTGEAPEFLLCSK